MTTELHGIRAQILANAKILVKPTIRFYEPNIGSQSTLHVPIINPFEGMDVVVFGAPGEYVAALMVGLVPAIEGAQAPNPEGAIRKLFLATCELLETYIPKVGAHQRNVHGGGVFDEDMINPELAVPLRKSSL